VAEYNIMCLVYSQARSGGEKDFRLVSKVSMNSHVKMNPFYESEVFLVLDAVVGIRTDTTQEQFADTPRSMSCSSPTSNPPSSFAYSQNH
jgi:hypothetical protein